MSQVNDIRRRKALLSAHSQLANETVVRIEEFTKQMQRQHDRLSELRRYHSLSLPRVGSGAL